NFTGEESMSGLFAFRVEVAGLDLDPEVLLDQPVLLTIPGAETPRFIHGLVAESGYLGHTRDLELYELTIAPWAHRLQYRHSCRIFQDKTTEQIVTEVLTAAGLPSDWFRFALSESYAPR